jgi:hypothetical protein
MIDRITLGQRDPLWVGGIDRRTISSNPQEESFSTTFEGQNGLCFLRTTAGTPVQTATGLVPIEELKVGDAVKTKKSEHAETRLRQVVATFEASGKQLLLLTVVLASGETEKLNVTAEHPFWTKVGWKEASAIVPGQEIQTASGEWASSKSLQFGRSNQHVYNVEVDEDHTYFVGRLGIWVHNNNCRLPRGGRLSGKSPPISPRQRLHPDGTPGKSQFNPGIDADGVTRTAWEQGAAVFNSAGKFLGKGFTFKGPVGTSPSGHAQSSVFVHWSPTRGIHGVPTTRGAW